MAIALMHVRQLVDLAALVALRGPLVVRQADAISDRALEQYWTASKCRLDRWARGLKSLAPVAARASAEAARQQQARLHGLIEEILVGEILTRVWTAVLSAHDRRQGDDRAEPIARSVLIGHLEARHRVLLLLVSAPSIHVEEAVKLNRLRRRAERWSDLLVGWLAASDDVAQFAVEPNRAEDFAREVRGYARGPVASAARALISTSLRAAFLDGLASCSPNEDLNLAIVESILGCFPADVFDGTGLFRSLWLVRLAQVPQEAAGLLDQLIKPAAGPAGRLSRFGRLDPHGPWR